MRLLKYEYKSAGWFSLPVLELKLVTVDRHKTPRYAVLSHRWAENSEEEVSFKDLENGTGKKKIGYRKLDFCAKQALRDGLEYFWVDTCCIDKSSSAELSESINKMFQWYRSASKCYVYLADVGAQDNNGHRVAQDMWEPAFRESEWFTRGWTLQELIAPALVDFFSMEGELLGDKISLQRQIQDITGISLQALQGGPLAQFEFAERMSWTKRRKTTVEEDAAYCLLGIFDVHMPLIYGEGEKRALFRLRKEFEEVRKYPSFEWNEDVSSSMPLETRSSQGLKTDTIRESSVKKSSPFSISKESRGTGRIGTMLKFIFNSRGSTQYPMVLKGHRRRARTVTFSPDGKLIVSSSEDGTVRFWNTANGRCCQIAKAKVIAIAFSPDSSLVAFATVDCEVDLWDPATGEHRGTMRGHTSVVGAVAFSQDSRLIASASDDGTIKLWHSATLQVCWTLQHKGSVLGVAFSPNGNLVASASKDGTIRLWDTVTGQRSKIYKGYGCWAVAVTFSPDGKLAASGLRNGIIELWNPTTGELRGILEGQIGMICKIAFSPDGKLVVAAGESNVFRLWDSATYEEMGKSGGDRGMIFDVAISPKGSLLASAAEDGTVTLWDLSTVQKEKRELTSLLR